MEVPYDANRQALNALMLAELAEGKGRFIDQLPVSYTHLDVYKRQRLLTSFTLFTPLRKKPGQSKSLGVSSIWKDIGE